MSLRRRDFLLSLTAGIAGAIVPTGAKARGIARAGGAGRKTVGIAPAAETALAATPAPTVVAAAETTPPPAIPEPGAAPALGGIDVLVAPLAAGVRLGSWRVERLSELEDGAASLVLRDAAGFTFQLDVCARDHAEGALVPPGRSAHFDVYLANGGRGDTASFEHHGLAAMAVADVIRKNEATFDRTGYRTLRERLSISYGSVKRRA
jgi:hypothetical protein